MDKNTYRIKVKLKNAEVEVEGDKEFVREEIRKLIEVINVITGIETEETHTNGTENKVSTVNTIKEPQKEILYESFAELYKVFKPKTKQEISLIAVYWLNKIKGKDKVTPNDVKMLLKDASIPEPSDIARDMRVLASGSKAYLIKMSETSRGKIPEYKISMSGEEYIISRLNKVGKSKT